MALARLRILIPVPPEVTAMRNTRGVLGLVLSAAVATGVLTLPTDLNAQTGFVPYYGKNLIRYDRFDWHIYTTEHFEIYYYPELEEHLERVAGYAESAYQHISGELKHDLASKVPLILFKTHAEFQQQNVIPGAVQEGIAAFAESTRDRILLPIDEPPDLLYRLIVHELTHVFEYDIIPMSLLRRGVPLWVMEGLADYLTGYWRPFDLMTVRDAAVADIVPKLSRMEGYGNFSNPRLVYNLGHAAFEFMESRWGKEGIRQFLFSLRKSVIGGGDNPYEEAFGLKPEEFDQQFDRYLKERFKPFRDKERPGDYGRNLAPDAEKGNYYGAFSIEPSPSGELLATMTANRRDRELDIVLLSTRDGAVVRNLTPGFDKDMGFEHISIPGSRWNTVPWMSWSPDGDLLAYFVRTERARTLILQNVVNRRIEQRIPMAMVDEPESPSISPDGRKVVFSALQNAVGNIFLLDLETLEVENLTNDEFANYAPAFSPDGSFIVYLTRVSGNEKLFRLDLESRRKTQLTFGTHDEAAARFLDADTLVFPSTATDPMQPLDAEIARNGNIFNLWTLSLKTGELRQWTDALGGNTSPVVLNHRAGPRVAFVSYYKGEYGVHTLDRKEPIQVASTNDFGAPGPIIDFQAPLTHTLVADNQRRKGTFEKLFVDGRPPVNVGVTSGGDIFGGSQISFSDVLGDQRFSLLAASIQQYRTLAFSYLNLSRRLQYATQAYSQTQFFYGQLEGIFYDPMFSGFIDRDLAVATRTYRGASVFGFYPFNRYRRVELSAGVFQRIERFNDPGLEDYSRWYQQQRFGRDLFQNGTSFPFGIAFVEETTVFREFGPLAGRTMRLGYEIAPGVGNSLSQQTVDLDARYYQRLGGSGLLALRARGFKSWGDAPNFFFFGGNSEMRGYQYLEFLGQKGAFLNAELRFPLIEAMLTPIGVMGGIRGVLFANAGGAGFDNTGFKFWDSGTELIETIAGFDFFGNPIPGPTIPITGFRLVNARASYGIGLQTFALGFPIHFDWSWRTLFNRQWEELLNWPYGGSEAFRKPKFSVWIGYDF
jgi:hypothetical protein